MSRKLVIASVAIVAVQIAGFVLFGSSRDPAQVRNAALISNLVQILSALVAAGACLYALRRARGGQRTFWTLFVVAFASYGAVQSAWMYYELWRPAVPGVTRMLLSVCLTVTVTLNEAVLPLPGVTVST